MPPRTRATKPADEQADAVQTVAESLGATVMTVTTQADPSEVPPVWVPPVDTPNVHVALARAAAEVDAVAKEHRADPKMGAYKYRSVDDVMDAAHGPLSRNGVSIVPTGFTLLENRFVEDTAKHRTQHHMVGIVHFDVCGPAGDRIKGAFPAGSADYSDKAPYQMMSNAYKYFVLQALCIPVSDVEETDGRGEDSTLTARQGTPPAPTQLSVEELQAKVAEAATTLGVDVDTATGKFRAERKTGDEPLTLDEMWALPYEVLFPFVRSLVAYSLQHPAKTEEETT